MIGVFADSSKLNRIITFTVRMLVILTVFFYLGLTIPVHRSANNSLFLAWSEV